jgi:putative oxidoreductase
MAKARTFFMARFENATLTLLRVMAGLFFMQHGVQKMFGVLGGWRGEPGLTAPLLSQNGLAGVLEVFGGLLFVLGLFTRPVAFILAGMMAVAYFQMHAPSGFWPILNRGELAALFCFVFFFFSARGAGPYSIDGVLESRRRSARMDFTR